jgi:hypothetical protein
MANDPKKDNSTLHQKIALRHRALDMLESWGVDAPVVMETHGGEGVLFNACYSHLHDGVVFEVDEQKISTLAKQRPTWGVYQADSAEALAEGAGKHWVVDLLDVDPYGMTWDVIEAFFTSDRPFADRMILVVNDGLRKKLEAKGAWTVEYLAPIVRKYGNDIHPVYKEVAGELVAHFAAEAGYSVKQYVAYYCGHVLANTHYLVVLER